MEHAVLGAGAVGGFLGTALASLVEDVIVLVRPERLPGYPTNLSVERPSGTITAPVKVAATLPNSVDVLWIATKTYQLETALQAVQSSPHYIVPLLNGVDHVEVLRAHSGRDRVLPEKIAVEAERIAPGRFVQRSPFVNLNLVASGEQVLGAIVARLRDLGFTCRFIQNEPTLLWSKLCFLGPYALVTSASGRNKGEIYADAEWIRFVKTGNFRQVSGASDASKMQSKLLTHNLSDRRNHSLPTSPTRQRPARRRLRSHEQCGSNPKRA